jgi:hypothetical protein
MTLNFILAAPEAKSPINNALKIEGNFVFNWGIYFQVDDLPIKCEGGVLWNLFSVFSRIQKLYPQYLASQEGIKSYSSLPRQKTKDNAYREIRYSIIIFF